MRETLKKILELAKQLRAEEREEAAQSFLAALVDPDVDQAWADEVARRTNSAGTFYSAAEVLDEVQRRQSRGR